MPGSLPRSRRRRHVPCCSTHGSACETRWPAGVVTSHSANPARAAAGGSEARITHPTAITAATRRITTRTAGRRGDKIANRRPPGGSDLVDPDVRRLLAAPQEPQAATRLEHDLGRAGIRVVVDRRHRRAVGPGAADDHEVADPGTR